MCTQNTKVTFSLPTLIAHLMSCVFTLILHGQGSLSPKKASFSWEAGFKRALLGLLAACSVDPALADGSQGATGVRRGRGAWEVLLGPVAAFAEPRPGADRCEEHGRPGQGPQPGRLGALACL